MTSTEQAVQVDGDGASTILMAQSFPNSTFARSDYHDGSIEAARRRAREAGVGERVGRPYYCFSTMLGTPTSLSRDVGLAVGAQAGEARIRDVVTTAGFTRFRRVAETPLNVVYEARP